MVLKLFYWDKHRNTHLCTTRISSLLRLGPWFENQLPDIRVPDWQAYFCCRSFLHNCAQIQQLGTADITECITGSCNALRQNTTGWSLPVDHCSRLFRSWKAHYMSHLHLRWARWTATAVLPSKWEHLSATPRLPHDLSASVHIYD